MTDDFALVHQAITLKAAKNGGPSPGDILDLMFASHNDAEKRDAALETELKRIVSHLGSESEHTAVAIRELAMKVGGRAEAIDKAKAEVIREVESRDSWPVLDRVVAETRAAIADICRRAPRRATDPPEYDYSGVVMGRYAPPEDEDREMGDIRRVWRTTTWLGKTIVGAVVVALVGLSLALLLQSYTIERAHSEPEPAVTVSASPIP